MKSSRLILFATLLSCFLFNSIVKGEGKFRPGFIITNSNDTIRGYLQQYNINMFTKCHFKKNLSDNVTEYKPKDISGYRFDDNGKFFVSKDAPLKSGNKVLFLEYLIQGKANVYFMNDDMEHYFIETEKNKIIELSEKPELRHREDGTMYYREATYKAKLRYMLLDCPEISSEIDETELRPSNMIKLAKDYHNKICNSEQCTIFEQKIKPFKINFTVVGGICLNKFHVGSSYSDYIADGLIGCKLDFENLFFSGEQSFFQLGLLLQHYSNYSFYTKIYLQDLHTYTTTDIVKSNLNAFALKIPITYNYTFSIGKIRPYVGAGMTNVFVLSKNKDIMSLTGYNDPFPFYRVGLLGQVGTKYKLNDKHQLILELSYESCISLNGAYSWFKLHNNNFSLVLGYTL